MRRKPNSPQQARGRQLPWRDAVAGIGPAVAEACGEEPRRHAGRPIASSDVRRAPASSARRTAAAQSLKVSAATAILIDLRARSRAAGGSGPRARVGGAVELVVRDDDAAAVATRDQVGREGRAASTSTNSAPASTRGLQDAAALVLGSRERPPSHAARHVDDHRRRRPASAPARRDGRRVEAQLDEVGVRHGVARRPAGASVVGSATVAQRSGSAAARKAQRPKIKKPLQPAG